MADLYDDNVDDLIGIWLRKRRHSMEDGKWQSIVKKIKQSSLLYVGNLSFYTTEEQIYHFFGTIAPIKRVIMGLNRESKTPCGFCFVEYFSHEDACSAVYYLNRLRLDGRNVHVDLDSEFVEGRQYGRGESGGQMRDDIRREHKFRIDPDRGDEVTEEVAVETEEGEDLTKRQRVEE